MAVSKRLRFEIFRRDNHTCRYCGANGEGVKLVIDHVTPEALGGGDEPSNLATACDPCNSGKTSIAPGSPLVADVAADAVRWSAALQAAGNEMLADLARQVQVRAPFEAMWFDYGQRVAQLPDGWRHSIDRLLAAGLPMPVLQECLSLSVNMDKVPPAGKFKYTCGIAWKKVRALQEAAQCQVGGEAPSRSSDPDDGPALASWASVAKDILVEHLGSEEVDRLIERQLLPDPDGYVYTPDAAVLGALCDTADNRLGLIRNVSRNAKTALSLLPEGAALLSLAKSEAEYMLEDEDEIEQSWIKVRAANWATEIIWFRTLKPEAQAGFFACADEFGYYERFETPESEGLGRLVFAAGYATDRHNSKARSGICPVGGRGSIPVPCTRRTSQAVTFDHCWSGCPDPCKGHALCEDHALAFMEGESVNPRTGAAAVVVACEEITDPWGQAPPF